MFVYSLNFMILCSAEIVQHKDIRRASGIHMRWVIIVVNDTETPFVQFVYLFIYLLFFIYCRSYKNNKINELKSTKNYINY